MVIRGMTISLPWFAFINVSFALIILLRRVLFNDLTPPWLNEKSLIHSIDISATGILLICSGLLLIPRQKTLPIQVLLVALSLLWSWCSYHFIAYWTLQFAYPLCVLLMLS
ncbi:membrane-associated sensor domain-containing protein, partial [Escherichia coli]|nr:membrane-associated sensor domain-containing protein [Escherichia coli]EME3720693.1 membrane-associated sensor domain-containing protein [Escherichia coli]